MQEENEILAAEKCVIGSIMYDNACLQELYGYLYPDHFQLPVFQRTYRAMLELYTNNEMITIVSVASKIKHDGEKDCPEWVMSMFKECLDGVVTVVGIKQHAKIIIDEYKRQEFKKIVTEKQKGTVEDVIGNIVNKLQDLMVDKKSNSKTIVEIYEENAHKYFNPEYREKYLYLGIPDLDLLLGGLEDTDMMCIGARPAVGKSAFALQLAWNISQHTKVKFYTFEMNHKQILDRLLANQSKIELQHIRKNKAFLNKGEEQAFEYGKKAIFANNNLIIEESAKTVSEIRNECRYIDGLGLIIIDYLQLMKNENGTRYGSRSEQVGAISKALRALALEIHVPIIILSQLNRAVESRVDKKPSLSDLRESGDIEQDCTQVAFLWKPDEENDEIRGFNIAKNRQGSTGDVKLLYEGQYMRFSQLDTHYIPYPKTPIPQEKKDSFASLSNLQNPFDEQINLEQLAMEQEIDQFERAYSTPPTDKQALDKYWQDIANVGDALLKKYNNNPFVSTQLQKLMEKWSGRRT